MKKCLLFAVIITAMMGCTKEAWLPPVSNSPIALSASIGVLTRATLSDAEAQNTQFVSGKSILVEAYETGGATTYTSGNYTTGDAGAMSGSLYYPASLANIDICAFYPATVNSATTSFSVGANQTSAALYEDYDLMYATKLTNRAKGTTHALTFNHALAKIIVTLSPSDGVTSGNISTNVSAVKINNTKLTATTSVSAGAITVSGVTGDATDIEITGTNVASQAGIIVPQTVAAGAFITITYNDQEYVYSLPASATFAAGTVYTYALTIGTAGIVLTSSTITNWTDGGTTNGIITL